MGLSSGFTMATPSMNMRDPYSARVPGARAQRCKYDTCGAEPMRAEPTGLAGRRLNRSAKVSPVASLVEAVEFDLQGNSGPKDSNHSWIGDPPAGSMDRLLGQKLRTWLPACFPFCLAW